MRLEINDLRVAYGKIEAVKGISLVVNQGEIVSLIGANGAGKTTLLKTISGLLNPTSGTITYDGEDILKYKAHQRVSLGISQAPEGRGIFPGMSVLENLELGKYHLKMKKSEIAEDLATVYELFPRLKERSTQAGGTLSGGEQQMLAVGRILRTGARFLLLDEISEGLAPVIVQALARMITALKAKGFTIIMVEQNFRFAAPLADRFYVMEHGQIVEGFSSQELSSKMGMLHEYLGV